MPQQVTSGLLFYPRGGSSQVVRYLRRALADDGWNVPLAVGSLGVEGQQSNARTFFGREQLCSMDYTPAIRDHELGNDPIAAQAPLHPSYEDRSGAPDRIFSAVSPLLARHLTCSWKALLQDGGLEATDVFHMHHLTPQFAAVAQLWPEKPIIGHLHGTELKMIEQIFERREIARMLGADLATAAKDLWNGNLSISHLSARQREIFRTTNWAQWRYGDFWEAQLRAYAQQCRCLIVISAHDKILAQKLLGVSAERLELVPNGVDNQIFDRDSVSPPEKLERLRHWLVADPQGWDESGVPGSVKYTDRDLERFVDPGSGAMQPVLLFVGRFLDFKRVPLLIRAYQRARPYFKRPAPLVIWGGSPGEWEGEHPYAVAQAGGADGIFFTGWRGHEDLPLGLNCADVMVAPSHNEPFGQVYLEAMAAGLPVIATRSGGPPSFVNVDRNRPNGWLFPPDDLDALVTTLIEVVNNPQERRSRADNAYAQIRSAYAWTSLAKRFEQLYNREIDQRS